MRHRIEHISHDFPYIVYEWEDRIIGYAYAHLWQERAAYRHTWETTVYVASHATGQGIGRMLMEQLIQICNTPDCHALIACITDGNTASIRLHEQLGFKQVAFYEKVGLKFGKRLNVVDMELLLQA